jgi:hypothetical protein
MHWPVIAGYLAKRALSMDSLWAQFGTPISISQSKRPGLRSALSIKLGELVAASTKTLLAVVVNYKIN